MKTNEIIEKLVGYRKTQIKTVLFLEGSQRYVAKPNIPMLFTEYLIEYFGKLDIPKEESDLYYRTELHLPVLLLRAVTLLNESSEPWVVAYRDKYKSLCDGKNEITDMISISNKSLSAIYDIHEFIKILEKAIGLEYIDYSMLQAEGLVLMLRFNQFIDKIYVNGDMGDFVRSHKYRRIEGTFGETKLAYDEALGGFYMIF
ncbi:MAG TPA: hypothetical protein VIK26_06515, partial [Clostridium sp.]